MSVIGNRFSHAHKTGCAVPPISISNGNTTATSVAIVEPWKYGRQIAFQVIGGVLAAGATVTGTIQGQKRSDSNWEAITDLTFDSASLSDTGAVEGGSVLGELDLGALDSSTYSGIRLVLAETATAAAVVGASYTIYDLYREPSGEAADLWDAQRAS